MIKQWKDKMNDGLDLLSIGDASLDVFVEPSESESLCRIDEKECLICFEYGDKIPVKDFNISIGGNAANNSVGTKRLGINSGAVLTLGDDQTGNHIVELLKSEGVNTDLVTQQPSTLSNYSTIIRYSGERTIFSYKVPRDYGFPVSLPITPWVYLTSMGDSFKPYYAKLVEWIKANPNIKLGFNPGSRQLRAGLDYFRDVLSVTYIIFVNRKEAEDLTGIESSEGKDKELLTAMCNLGPKIAVITDGPNGSLVFDGNKYYKCGILPIDACERTGAGDAFGSGCLAALIKGKGFEEALIWGTVNSASVIGYVGSQRGLLKLDQLDEWLNRAESCELRVEEF